MNLSISREGTEIGEWTEEEVRVFYTEGRLVATDLYWTEGMSAWESLASFIKPPPPFPPKESAEISDVASTPEIKESPKAKKQGAWLGLIGSFVLIAICHQLPQLFPSSPLSLYGGAAGLVIGFYIYFNSRIKEPSKNYNYILWNGAAIGIVAGLLTSAVLYYFSFVRVLKEESDSMNMSMPEALDTVAQIESTSVTPDKVFHYNCSLLTTYVPSPGYKANIKEQLLAAYRKSPDYRRYLDEGVKYEMDFFDPNRTFLTAVSVGPEDAR